jgi:hypothetical protein
VTRNTAAVFVVLALAMSAETTAAQSLTCGQKFRDLTAEYDPLSDTTRAFSPYHTIDGPLLSTNAADGWSFFLMAAHTGKKSDSLVVPRVFATGTRGARTEAGLAGMSPQFSQATQFTILVDDSVRMAWPAKSYVESTSNDMMWGPRKSEILRFEPPIEDLRRMAAGKKAVVAFGPVRENVKEKSMQRFAEVVRWSECPTDRPAPRTKR